MSKPESGIDLWKLASQQALEEVERRCRQILTGSSDAFGLDKLIVLRKGVLKLQTYVGQVLESLRLADEIRVIPPDIKPDFHERLRNG
jgi:hypothetical protein